MSAVEQTIGGSSLEETRLRNIARNNDFLKSLFGPSDEASCVAVDNGNKDEKVTPHLSNEQKISFEKYCINTKKSLVELYPFRKTEIGELIAFVNPVRLQFISRFFMNMQ